jgi:hypothetical protein
MAPKSQVENHAIIITAVKAILAHHFHFEVGCSTDEFLAQIDATSQEGQVQWLLTTDSNASMGAQRGTLGPCASPAFDTRKANLIRRDLAPMRDDCVTPVLIHPISFSYRRRFDSFFEYRKTKIERKRTVCSDPKAVPLGK